MSVENTPTSSNPDDGLPFTPPQTIVCFDPADGTQPCPICTGIGVVRMEVPYGDPRFGKLHRCPNMQTNTDPQRQDKLRKASNMGVYSHKTFATFEVARPGYTQQEVTSLRSAFNSAEIYARSLKGWFLIEGSYGTGKTHLAAAIGNARLAEGDPVMFMTTPDLLDQLRSGFGANADSSYDETFERIKDVAMLIIDDLGAENPSEWANEKLFQLLNHRYVNEKATVITTNNDIERLDQRLASRLRDINVVRRIVISAPDYRDVSKRVNGDLLMRLSPYEDMVFDSFDTARYANPDEAQNLTNAARAAYDYAREPRGWLVLMGGYGTGKTHLAAAIANFQRMRFDTPVMLMTMPDLLDILKATFSPDSARNFDELFDTIRNVEMLVLDDFSLDNAKQWTSEKLFQLLDHRYVRRLATVITTARSLDDLERSHPRLISRLIDPRVCRVVAIHARAYALRLNKGR